jgi:hypothetical protein
MFAISQCTTGGGNQESATRQTVQEQRAADNENACQTGMNVLCYSSQVLNCDNLNVQSDVSRVCSAHDSALLSKLQLCVY